MGSAGLPPLRCHGPCHVLPAGSTMVAGTLLPALCRQSVQPAGRSRRGYADTGGRRLCLQAATERTSGRSISQRSASPGAMSSFDARCRTGVSSGQTAQGQRNVAAGRPARLANCGSGDYTWAGLFTNWSAGTSKRRLGCQVRFFAPGTERHRAPVSGRGVCEVPADISMCQVW